MVNQLENAANARRMLGARKAPNRYAKNNDVFVANVGEKRYLWTARAFAIVTAFSLCCNIVLLLALSQVIPLYRVEPFLLSFQNKSEQIYNIQPVRENLKDQSAITEVFVREYVLLRSSFDTDVPELEVRWMPDGPIQEMSSPKVYQDFLNRTAKKALKIVKTKGLVRSVKILSVNELKVGLWQVEYETSDMYPSSMKPDINYWTASLQVGYRRKTVKHGDRLKNPVGFTVLRYSLSYNKVE